MLITVKSRWYAPVYTPPPLAKYMPPQICNPINILNISLPKYRPITFVKSTKHQVY